MSELKQTKIDTWFRMTKGDKRMMHRKLMLKRTKNNTIVDTIDLTKEDSPSKKSKLNSESSKSAVNGSVLNSKKISSDNVDNNLNAISIKTEVNINLSENIELLLSLKSCTNPEIGSTNQVNGNSNLSSKSNNLYTIQFNTENSESFVLKKSEFNQEYDGSETKTPGVNKNVRLLEKKLQQDNLKTNKNGNLKFLRSKKSKLKTQGNGDVNTNANKKVIKVKKEINTDQSVYMKYDITDILSSESNSENEFSSSLKNETLSNRERLKYKRSTRLEKNIASSKKFLKSTNSVCSEDRKPLNTSMSKESLKTKSISFSEEKRRENSAVYGECSKTSHVETCKVENISSSSLITSEDKKLNENNKEGKALLNTESSNSRSSERKRENISSPKHENSTTSLNAEFKTNYKPFISVRRDIFENISIRNTAEVVNGNENLLDNINLENSSKIKLADHSEKVLIGINKKEERNWISKLNDSISLRKSDSFSNLENSNKENDASTSESLKSTILTSTENTIGENTSLKKEVNTTPKKEENAASTSESLKSIILTSTEDIIKENTSPKKEINTTPKKGINNSPRRGAYTSPRRRGYTSPKKGLNTSPSKSENDDNDNYDYFVRDFHYMLNYISKHKELYLLLNENQKKILENLKAFNFKERKLCIRLYYRKLMWYRLENIRTDKNLSINLDTNEMSTLIHNLSSNYFLDTNISIENLENLLKLLSAPELKDIMKLYKIKSECKKREGIIQRIIKNTKNQKLMFGNPEEKLKKDICKVLGFCIKLTDTFVGCMQRIHLLFGITENKTPQEMHRFLLEFLRKPIENRLKFQIDYPKLFENEKEFSDYEENRLQYEKFLSAVENKDNYTAMIIILRAFLKYESSIHYDKFSRKIEEKSSFLRKFSSSYCIIRILSEGITILKQEFKKTSNSSEDTNKMVDELLLGELLQQNFHTSEFKDIHIIQILDALLAQDLFRTHKKTEWLKEKFMILKYLDISKAFHEFIDIAKIDEYKNNKLTQIYFYEEIQSFLKSKKLSVEQKEQLQKLKLQMPCYRFPSITIWAVEVPNNVSGRKKMYKSKDDNGQSYSSVEEVAISYYKKYLDYEDGIHCEGSLLSTLFDILFWDLIYEYYVPNTFISPIQSRPLDMFSRWFYTNRKDVIDVRLNNIEKWDENEFELQLQTMLEKISKYMTQSTLADVQLLMTFVKSINREVLVKMLRKLIEELGTYRAGFPDIILWNTRTKKCKFAEVKGQHDKLRPKQILWLQFLLSIGADAELCHVHTTGYSKIAS